jgi:predicted nuclease of predicted toxin-antitoxin system
VRFLLDENISYRVCAHLKAAGHDAVHVDEIGLASTDDLVIAARAREQDRILVSCDHDFMQILFASGEIRPSLLLMREVDTLPSDEIASLLLAAMSSELTELLSDGAIATLTPDRARVRPLPLRKVAGS